MQTQLNLFKEVEVGVDNPEPKTEVTLGNHSAQVPLRTRRREALKKLLAVLSELEGQTVHISYCSGSHGHFWLNNLRLDRLRVDKPWWLREDGEKEDWGSPTIVLWANRAASVRIFTEVLFDVRIQEYFGYDHYLIDFWNGFGDYPIYPYRPGGFDSLSITKFKD